MPWNVALAGRAVTVLLLAALLTGCQRKAPTPAAVSTSAAGGGTAAGPTSGPTSALPHPLPGLYRSTVTLLALDAPGLPPAAVAGIHAAMDRKAAGSTSCLSADEAASGYEARVRKLAGRPSCAFDHFSVQGDVLDARLACGGAGGNHAELTLHGTMTPTGSDVRMTVHQVAAQGPAGGVTMTMQVKSVREGDCP